VIPTRTYMSDSGHFCREYREELMVGDRSGTFHHAACRDENARWVWL
jgi:surface antigen